MLDEDVDEVYQQEELTHSFMVDPSAELADLVGDACDIEMSVVKPDVKQKWKLIKKKISCLD
jgi:hypothetical protein